MGEYKSYWEKEQARREMASYWVKARMKELGYKSMAQFRRENAGLSVTAGTVSNWLRWGTIPLWAVPQLCYALKVTPTQFLTAIGMYDPSKMSGGEING
jgi:hypothetical protein